MGKGLQPGTGGPQRGRGTPEGLGTPGLILSPCLSVSLSPELAVVGEPMNRSVAHAVAVAGGRVYVSGGFNGVALGRLSALRLPADPCLSLPGPEACNRSGAACSWCHGSCLSADAAER